MPIYAHAPSRLFSLQVHRIGQTKPVVVKRLVVADSVEQRILALQERKKMMADASLGEGSGQK